MQMDSTRRPATGLSSSRMSCSVRSASHSEGSRRSGHPSQIASGSGAQAAGLGSGLSSRSSRNSEANLLRASGRGALAPLPESGQITVNTIPGYSGHVPGKVAKNVYGHSFQTINEQAAEAIEMARRGIRSSDARLTMTGPRPGCEIPGYQGFVPGRSADNVIGQTQTRGAETAFFLKAHQAQEKEFRIAHYRQGMRPPTGTADYGGYRNAGSISHTIDARHHA